MSSYSPTPSSSHLDNSGNWLRPAPQHAAIDLTSGYDATAFLSSATGGESWNRECFVAVVDTVVNHRTIVYPLPTRYSQTTDRPELLPKLVDLFRRVSLVDPVESAVAENVLPTDETIKKEFHNFIKWAPLNAVPSNRDGRGGISWQLRSRKAEFRATRIGLSTSLRICVIERC